MKFFAISDLHLSPVKPMDKFGDHWKDHATKIKANWASKISPDDVVFVPGDISWALKWHEAITELEFLQSLPGTKIIVKGNHDYWIESESAAKKALKEFDTEFSRVRLIHNDSMVLGDNIALAGTRGWSRRASAPDNERILNRELKRLECSLLSIEKFTYRKLVVMTHFPITNKIFDHVERELNPERKTDTVTLSNSSELIYEETFDERFLETLKKYGVDVHIFGHVHNLIFSTPMNIEGIKSYCVAADAINFNPVLVEL